MNILITSGSIPEFVDDVYYLESIGNNRLGAIVAEELSRHKKVEKIFFLYAHHTNTPYSSTSSYTQKFFLEEWAEKLMLKEVNTIHELEKEIHSISKENEIDMVLHLMSIPNYQSDDVFLLNNQSDAKKIIEKIANDFSIDFQFLNTNKDEQNESHDSPSNHGDKSAILSGYKQLYIHQKPNTKVLSVIRKLFPSAIVFSSKIRNNHSSEELLEGANISLKRNQSNLVIAVDLYESKKSYKDVCYVIHGDDKVERFNSFEGLSEFIYSHFISEE